MPQENLPWYRRLHWQILIAMALGTVVGLVGGTEVVPKVDWLGTLFIKLLKMIIVPLILTSIVSGVASVGGGRDLGRLFGKTLGYYVLSSALAIFAGLFAVNLIRPGFGANIVGAESDPFRGALTRHVVSGAAGVRLELIPDGNVKEAELEVVSLRPAGCS